ncbi:MAG TPA: alkaline phosphatase family protein, partial [Vicinamibacteria bacterium]|nr:alkaline phosphatase family protein [Vicinamibacteria bacterium]
MKRALALVAAASVALSGCRRSEPLSRSISRHVLLLHLDGFRPDLTKTLLAEGRLPNLSRLASRGRISYEAATVDKSETMKVIPAYLTSQLDTSLLGVSGWWQFDRGDFRFRNFWLDPGEVVSYALGLGFPRAPTVQDFLSARGENLVAGMSLARRGVPFLNYGRAYLEGIEAVGSHTYLRQADATMSAFLDVHRRIAERSEPSPKLSTLLLAAADEFAHAEGVSVPGGASEHCFDREQEADETAFRLVDEDKERDRPYFT